MTVAFKTFGCRLNRAEALDLEASFRAAGHTILQLNERAPDVIVVRCCSVTARAQRDCEKEIAHLRERFPQSRVIITGCHPNSEQVKVNSEQVETESNSTLNTQHSTLPLREDLESYPSRASLKVQDGCSGHCAFCIVPHFRGKPVSVPFDQVLSRARAFLDLGFHELVITGCNLALYRSQGHGLPDLLAALADLTAAPSSHRIRLGSLEPGICDDALLDAFTSHPNICRFIHLSVQSGSDPVLNRMNRPYTIDTVRRFCTEARRRLGPRLTLGADIITGFPGETDADFQLTKTFLFPPEGAASFSNLHVFPYSERPGTPAATMDGALPRAIRLTRARNLEKDAKAARLTFVQSFLGQEVEVCIERGGDHGWTAEYLPCKIEGAPAPRRSLLTVRVIAVSDTGELLGRRI